jgi:hypothetical protein
MVILLLLGAGVIAWWLMKGQQPAPAPVTPIATSTKITDPYTRAASFLYTAITNPNSVQHSFGLPGTGAWGSGMFKSGTYPTLKPDEQLYVTLSEAAYDCQEADNHLKCTVAQFILPDISPCTSKNRGGCDFDPNSPLAQGGGHMAYKGNYVVSFNQNGVQRTGTMRRVRPPGYSESWIDWLKSQGVNINAQGDRI